MRRRSLENAAEIGNLKRVAPARPLLAVSFIERHPQGLLVGYCVFAGKFLYKDCVHTPSYPRHSNNQHLRLPTTLLRSIAAQVCRVSAMCSVLRQCPSHTIATFLERAFLVTCVECGANIKAETRTGRSQLGDSEDRRGRSWRHMALKERPSRPRRVPEAGPGRDERTGSGTESILTHTDSSRGGGCELRMRKPLSVLRPASQPAWTSCPQDMSTSGSVHQVNSLCIFHCVQWSSHFPILLACSFLFARVDPACLISRGETGASVR